MGDDVFFQLKLPRTFTDKISSLFTFYHFGFVNICICISFLLLILKKWFYRSRHSILEFNNNPKRLNFPIEQTQKNRSFKNTFSKIHVFLLIFYFGTLLLWRLRLTEIRYIMALDALAGILVFLGILRLGNQKRKQILYLTLLSIGMLVILKGDLIQSRSSPESLKNMQQRAGWRSSIYEKKWELPELPENTLVLTGVQTSFIAPFLAEKTPSVTFVGGVSNSITVNVFPDSIMKQKITDKIKKHIGPIYLLTIPEINDPLIKAMNLRDEMGRPLLEINFFPQYGLELVQEKQIQISNKFGKFLLIPTRPETKTKNP
jgi:hypothetical protein